MQIDYLPSNRQRLSSGDCWEDKKEDYCVVLCATVVCDEKHTEHEKFFQMN